jgi:hypothetical protein
MTNITHMGQNKQINDHSISGKVLHVGQPEQYTTKAGTTIMSRIVVLEVFVGTYSNEVPFEATMANMNQLLQIKEGEWVTIQFCLRGNKTIKDGKAKWWPRLEILSIIKG